jgi:hypothetical protein
MNSTPTGGSATPSPDGDDMTEVEDLPAAESGGVAGGRSAGAAVPTVPAPRSGADPLPRRTRTRTEPREHAPDAGPARDPDGHRYTSADPATLDRLLTGLRDI